MNKRTLVLLFSILFIVIEVSAVEKSKLKISRLISPPDIDGIINDNAWLNLEEYSDFSKIEPLHNQSPSQRSIVKIGYDDDALYISANLLDSSKDSILYGLGPRDNGKSDIAEYFSIVINPYNDGVNAYEFLVTSPGVQSDFKLTGTSSDANWDAVWYSATSKNDDGWCVEIKIPFSAIRFPKRNVQTWGIQFYRQIKRKNELCAWSDINVLNQDYNSQLGIATGIEDVTPPLRLSFTPYVGLFTEKYQDADDYQEGISGGLDLKYGINESFTVDLTLIPDFSQVTSDDEVLNLTPYEIEYDENRPFFTEGVELFTKGNLFYSRRIGGEPRNYSSANNSLSDSEILLENKSETELINAVKVSGRDKNGLAIGIFNAITGATEAKITDTISLEKRKLITQGVTNYNLFVLDKNLKNNSYINIGNSYVSDFDLDYNANVTALTLRLNNEKNSFRLAASAGHSVITNVDEKTQGNRYSLSLAKTKGNFLTSLSHSLIDEQYDCNDLGYLSVNNIMTNTLSMNYNIYEPFSAFRKLKSSVSFTNKYLVKPFEYTVFQVSYSLSAKLKEPNSIDLGLSGTIYPIEGHDYDETRTTSRYYLVPRSASIKGSISTDYRKPIALDAYVEKEKRDIVDSYCTTYFLAPRLMPNNKFVLSPSITYIDESKDIGYIKKEDDNIFFGMRDIETFENTINLSYVFDPSSTITMKVRHYWSKVDYEAVSPLEKDGSFSAIKNSDIDPETNNLNYNLFNIDFVYYWQFVPGSEITIVWKNSFEKQSNITPEGYWTDLEDMMGMSHHNIFSLKLLYYIDYQGIVKNIFKKS